MKVSALRVKKYTPPVLAYAVRYLILLCFSYALLYPFVYMGVNAVKTPMDWLDPT